MWRRPAFFSAVAHVRFTMRTGRSRKVMTRPESLRLSSKNSCSRSVNGISRDSPSGVLERVTNSSLREKSISSHIWLVISPRRMPVSKAAMIMARRWSLAAPRSSNSSATLITWRRMRRSRAILRRASGLAKSSCSSTPQYRIWRSTLKSRLTVASLVDLPARRSLRNSSARDLVTLSTAISAKNGSRNLR